jgi:hypothetical protein
LAYPDRTIDSTSDWPRFLQLILPENRPDAKSFLLLDGKTAGEIKLIPQNRNSGVAKTA